VPPRRIQRISDMLKDVSPPALEDCSLMGLCRSTLRLMVPLLVVHDFNVADRIADDFYTIEIWQP
jgi:hypothetical protein